MESSDTSIPLEALPERLWTVLAPESPAARKMAVARAAIPLPPNELLPALAFLTNDPDPTVRDTSRKTLRELPDGTVTPVLSSISTNPGVLDRLSKVYWESHEYLESIVLNRATPDETFLHLAKHSTGVVLEIISQNQERIARTPGIVEALYFNPNTKMSTVSRVLEFAVRENLPIQSMPGYKEIVASVMGEMKSSPPPSLGGAALADAEAATPREAPRPAPQSEPEQRRPAPQAQQREAPGTAPAPAPDDEAAWDEAFDDSEWDDDKPEDADDSALFDELMSATSELEEDEWGDFEGEGTSPGADDDDDAFFAVLAASMTADDGDEGDGERGGQSWADKVRDLSISDRIRLALIGNSSARAALVRDANKLVSSAVLRNPGLNDKEIVSFARNKSVSQEVIIIISNTRDWARNPKVREGLVMNPKTPPHLAMRFLKFLHPNTLKAISKSREVPNVVARAAKRLLEQKRMG